MTANHVIDLTSPSATYRRNQQLGALEANTPEQLHHLSHEADVKDGSGQFNVPKVPWALPRGARTGNAPCPAIHGTLSRVHEAADLGRTILRGDCMTYATIGDGHVPLQTEKSYNFFW